MAEKIASRGVPRSSRAGCPGSDFGIAARLAREGATLSVWDRDADGLAGLGARLGRRRTPLALEVTDAEAVQAAADETAAALGRVDDPDRLRRHHRAERAGLGVSRRGVGPRHRRRT